MLPTHSFINHPRCIMFFSQHLSFLCQYHSTNAPYSFIHQPPTLYSLGNAQLRTKPTNLGDTLVSVRHKVLSLNIASLYSPCFTLNAGIINKGLYIFGIPKRLCVNINRRYTLIFDAILHWATLFYGDLQTAVLINCVECAKHNSVTIFH